MKSLTSDQALTWPLLAWLFVAVTAVVAPATAMLLFANASDPLPLAYTSGLILAVGLMGSGIIGAAAAGRFWTGTLLAVLVGVGLMLLARSLGMPTLPHPLSAGLAIFVASISFAARGALFARSAGGKGWLIALLVVAGEVAIVLTAWTQPDTWPDWLLALLPAQWASIAIQTALTGVGTTVAASALAALGGTAAATLLVAGLWPRRWPYLVMFTAWLGLSALVWYDPGPPMPNANLTITASAGGQ